MSIIKRISAPVGISHQSGAKSASGEGFVCPHCHRQTQLIPFKGGRVCQICLRAPEE